MADILFEACRGLKEVGRVDALWGSEFVGCQVAGTDLGLESGSTVSTILRYDCGHAADEHQSTMAKLNHAPIDALWRLSAN